MRLISQIKCNELVLTISETMGDEVFCVVPPWGSYVVPVVRHRRLGGTTLASVKNESVTKYGRIYYGMFSFFPVDAENQNGRRMP